MYSYCMFGTWCSVVVKALCYKSEGPGIDSRCRRGFFPWHLTVLCVLGSTQSLEMSTRIIVGLRRPVPEADNLPPSRADCQEIWGP